MSNILLLGASGFIGNSILRNGVENKSIKSIVAIQHKTKVKHYESDKVRIINGSIDHIELHTSGCDYLIHAARQSSQKNKIGRILLSLNGKNKNQNLLREFGLLQNIKRLSYVSGSLMYGNQGHSLITESNSINPVSFAKDYIYAEQPFIRQSKSDQRIQLIRVPWVFGNGSWFKKFYLDFMYKNNKVPLYGDGKNLMTFIEIDDVSKGILYANQKTEASVLNLFMPDYITQENFVNLISNFTGLGIHKYSDAQLKNSFENAVYQAFNTNIKLGSELDLQEQIIANMQFKTVSEMLSNKLPIYFL
ncbi:MAG: NAD-dependent epimerase/dehydratase family protein [Bacteroidota bacterium]